jgi:hypothetical protein
MNPFSINNSREWCQILISDLSIILSPIKMRSLFLTKTPAKPFRVDLETVERIRSSSEYILSHQGKDKGVRSSFLTELNAVSRMKT